MGFQQLADIGPEGGAVATDETELLLLGASGQVGREVIRTATGKRGIKLRTAGRSDPDPERRFDLEQPESLSRLIQRSRPAHVIICAAAANVAWCEQHPDESLLMNVHSPEAAARAAAEIGATVTFISTDYVFDGAAGPYPEGAPTRPINVYGSHKLAAEDAVLDVNPRALVIRSCQVFGDDPRRVNFVLRVVDRLQTQSTVEAASDLFGTPTYAPDLANGVLGLTLAGATGIWHVAGDTFLSRYALAKRAAQLFGYDSDAIVEVRADDMEDIVDRPRRAGLTNGRLAGTGWRWITPLDLAIRRLAQPESSQ